MLGDQGIANIPVRVKKFNRVKNIYLRGDAMIDHKRPFAGVDSKIDNGQKRKTSFNNQIDIYKADYLDDPKVSKSKNALIPQSQRHKFVYNSNITKDTGLALVEMSSSDALD